MLYVKNMIGIKEKSDIESAGIQVETLKSIVGEPVIQESPTGLDPLPIKPSLMERADTIEEVLVLMAEVIAL